VRNSNVTEKVLDFGEQDGAEEEEEKGMSTMVGSTISTSAMAETPSEEVAIVGSVAVGFCVSRVVRFISRNSIGGQ